MRTYIARSPHSRACHLCDTPILVGDAVVTWAWWNQNAEPGDGNMGNIMRVHASCHEIEMIAPREEFSPGDWGEDKARCAEECLRSARMRLSSADNRSRDA